MEKRTTDLYTLHLGESLEVLKTLPDCSVDAVVTDPPAGIAFLTRKWDTFRGRDEFVEFMTERIREACRVLKPGGYMLVWAIPRTSYWTAYACDEAGMEIREVVHHLFGTGFPKSLNISKKLDKRAGAERKVVGTRKMHDIRSGNYGHAGHRNTVADIEVTEAATDDAKKWEGWGTALSPAVEHWLLCQKPLAESTFADNIMAYGVGGINIDGCRAEHSEAIKLTSRQPDGGQTWSSEDCGLRKGGEGLASASPKGRWPSNLVLSHSPACTVEQCAPDCGVSSVDVQAVGASRFFIRLPAEEPLYLYSAKPDDGERNGGCAGFYWKRDESATTGFVRITREEWQQLGVQQAAEGKVLRARGNIHPTAKSVSLMRWLCRLITPAGGTVLDMFCGSGSTGIGAVMEGFKFIGVDMEDVYLSIAKARID